MSPSTAEDVDLIVEKIKKEDDIFAKAKLITQLRKESQISAKKIAEVLAIKPSYLSHILRVTRLPELIVDGYYSGSLSQSHLFIISRLPNEEQMIAVYEKILTENLTTVKTEEIVREALYKVKNGGHRLTQEELRDFTSKFEARLNSKIDITQTRVKGKMSFEIRGNLADTTPKLRRLMKILSTTKETST